MAISNAYSSLSGQITYFFGLVGEVGFICGKNPFMENQEQQVTVGFKVTGLQKKEIEAGAHRMEMDISGYLRSLTLGGHEKIVRFIAVPDALVVQPERVGEVTEVLKMLLDCYPDRSYSDIIAASLKAALENERRVVSLKIKNYLP